MNVRILTFFLFLGIYPAYSQGGITADRGNVIDKNTQKNLTEVYVAMPSKGYSSTTNEEGDFTPLDKPRKWTVLALKTEHLSLVVP